MTNPKGFGKMPKALNERRAKQSGNEKERAKAREKETEVERRQGTGEKSKERGRKMILFFKAAGKSESSARQLRKIKNLKKVVDKANDLC